MNDIRVGIMGHNISAYFDADGYELNLFDWSGRRHALVEIDELIGFLMRVRDEYRTARNESVTNSQPAPATLQSVTERAAVDEVLAEEAAWTTPATTEEMQSRAADSYDLFDDDEWYEDYDNSDEDDDEGGDDGSNHASRDPFSGKCYCPYCNSECAPDFCGGCHSDLTPPAIDTDMRPDLPDETPF